MSTDTSPDFNLPPVKVLPVISGIELSYDHEKQLFCLTQRTGSVIKCTYITLECLNNLAQPAGDLLLVVLINLVNK